MKSSHLSSRNFSSRLKPRNLFTEKPLQRLIRRPVFWYELVQATCAFSIRGKKNSFWWEEGSGRFGKEPDLRHGVKLATGEGKESLREEGDRVGGQPVGTEWQSLGAEAEQSVFRGAWLWLSGVPIYILWKDGLIFNIIVLYYVALFCFQYLGCTCNQPLHIPKKCSATPLWRQQLPLLPSGKYEEIQYMYIQWRFPKTLGSSSRLTNLVKNFRRIAN